MNDLISRQAVFDIIDDLRDRMTVEGYWSMVERVKALPSAQPERKTGHWIDAVIPNDSGGLPVIVCDKCNTFFPLQFGDGHNFCPNCGARMEGEG